MSRVEYHPLAADEITAAYEYLASHAGLEIADDFRRQVKEIITLCFRNPLIYRIRRYNVRRANLKRFSEYYLAYMLWEGRFVVIALGHAKRRPFYWYRRPKNFRDTY